MFTQTVTLPQQGISTTGRQRLKLRAHGKQVGLPKPLPRQIIYQAGDVLIKQIYPGINSRNNIGSKKTKVNKDFSRTYKKQDKYGDTEMLSLHRFVDFAI